MLQSCATPQTAAHQASPSLGFSRQEHWSGLPFPSLGDLPNPGIEPRSPTLQADTLPSEPPRNIGAPQYIRQTLTDIKGEVDTNTIIVGGFNTPLTPMDRTSKQKINKETQVLNNTLDEIDLIGLLRTFHPNAEEYTFSSSAHGTFPRIDHILGHKSNLSRFKKIEIISSVFSDHNAMRLDINYKIRTVINRNTWRLNNTFLSNK